MATPGPSTRRSPIVASSAARRVSRASPARGRCPPATPEDRSPRCAGCSCEAGVCAWQADGTGGILRVVSSEETDLRSSQAFRAYEARVRGRQAIPEKEKTTGAGPGGGVIDPERAGHTKVGEAPAETPTPSADKITADLTAEQRSLLPGRGGRPFPR